MADDPELSYLTGIGNMRPDTGTCIIIADPDYTEGLGSIIRQLAHIYDHGSLFMRHELHRDIQTTGDDFIDLSLDFSDLLLRGLSVKDIVAL